MKTFIKRAALLFLDKEDARLCPENDDTYRRYQRVLRSYYRRMAWQSHDCDHCGGTIRPGESYQAYVWLANPPRMIQGMLRRLWVEKHHYPLCPDDYHDLEEEMRRQWERHNAERKAAERKAA